jgi:hypothetical protein
MATIPVNPTGIVTTTTATGSFAGFTVVSGSATITGLKDANGSELTTTDWIIPAGFTIPIYVTSASLSSGAILLYP